jgi:hypothetical protein
VRARRQIGDQERRRRLVARHHLARTAPDAETAVRDLLAVHSSDPITPPLALRARVRGFTLPDWDAALAQRRTLWRLHAMRRTLFVVHVDDAATVLAACSRDVAAAERRKVEGWIAAARSDVDAAAHLRRLEDDVGTLLADGVPRSTRAIGVAVAGLDEQLTVGSGRHTAAVSLTSKVLLLLALDARIVRTPTSGTWLSSQYGWVARDAWFGERSAPGAARPGGSDVAADAGSDADAADARRDLVVRYLGAHGPATTTDVRWWTGWGVRTTRAALRDAAVGEVDLDDGATGWVLADDVDPSADATGAHGGGPVALLPGLDPTVMGWKDRDWYLGPHAKALFDRNGNAGPTIWFDGRVVGVWAVTPTGEVATHLLALADEAAVAAEAGVLTDWLAGTVPTPRFRTPLERHLAT